MKVLMADNLEVEKSSLHREICLPIARDPASQAVLEIAQKAAKCNATILLSGETGVGKEILARYIHQSSLVNQGPFISVNCAALPDNMVEAILFGYEKGAFTSAVSSYVGKFEQAHRGTLLLDEISEIPLALQAKLLRVLQEREIEKLGGKKSFHVDVRVIATTNRNLIQQVEAGYFRKDLYYRLNVLPINCTPLRNRKGDILPLAEFFLEQHSIGFNKIKPKLSENAKKKLENYPWPGNIREMENVIQRILIMNDAPIVEEHHIELAGESAEQNDMYVHPMHFDSKLAEGEAKIILDVLAEFSGCRNLTAKRLNISPRTLRYKISKLKAIGLDVP